MCAGGILCISREKVFFWHCAIVRRAHCTCLPTTGYAVVHQQLYFPFALPYLAWVKHPMLKKSVEISPTDRLVAPLYVFSILLLSKVGTTKQSRPPQAHTHTHTLSQCVPAYRIAANLKQNVKIYGLTSFSGPFEQPQEQVEARWGLLIEGGAPHVNIAFSF